MHFRLFGRQSEPVEEVLDRGEDVVERLDRAVERICRVMKPIGPTNLQFRMEGEHCYLLEVNPRISSSTSIRAALGYNEAKLCIEHYLEGKITMPEVKAGYAIRYIDEVVTVI